ncbi:L,D-transpeptidase family protein [bacterium]|nr:L,D-transpeptidase family protein [bacterium]
MRIIILTIGFSMVITSITSNLAEYKAPLLSINMVSNHLKNWVDNTEHKKTIRIGARTIAAVPWIKAFYSARNYKPVWLNVNGPLSRAYTLARAVEEVDKEGLRPEKYHVKKINKILKGIRQGKYQSGGFLHPVHLAALEIFLTDAFFMCASHLAWGQVDPRLVDERLLPEQIEHDFVALLNQTLETEDFLNFFARVVPKSREYQQLKTALVEYRLLQKKEKCLRIFPKLRLVKGVRDRRTIPALRYKLGLLGDLIQTSALDDTLFNDEVELALMHFQIRHGLKVSGELNEETIQQLNKPMEEYIVHLEANLERMRWRTYNWEDQYLVVNIPDFSLKMISKNKTVLHMRVVVGKQYTKTPIFSDKLRFVVLNPVWKIPPAIILREKLWKIRHEKNYFKRHHIKVTRGWGKNAQDIDPATVDWRKVRIKDFYGKYRFRQTSGPSNPLGRVKFMFPNKYNVYLHDTPQRKLFRKEARYFSSGCIRLEKPLKLAAACLRGNRFWTPRRIEAAVKGKLKQKIKLTKSIPIHILYRTAWVDKDGVVQFRKDIYGRDIKIIQAFRENYFPSL